MNRPDFKVWKNITNFALTGELWESIVSIPILEKFDCILTDHKGPVMWSFDAFLVVNRTSYWSNSRVSVGFRHHKRFRCRCRQFTRGATSVACLAGHLPQQDGGTQRRRHCGFQLPVAVLRDVTAGVGHSKALPWCGVSYFHDCKYMKTSS